MIIGYQVITSLNTLVPPYTAQDVLSASLAEKVVRAQRKHAPDTQLVAVLEGDIEHPNFIGGDTVFKTIIKDWQLYDQFSADDVSVQDRTEFVVDVGLNSNGSQLFISVYDEALEPHTNNMPTMGLNVLVEIRDGMPCLSAGISPDENVVHLVSNSVNELAVIQECDRDQPHHQPVTSLHSRQFNGLCFTRDDYGLLHEMREIILDTIIHDVEQTKHTLCPEQSVGHWTHQGDVYTTALWVEDAQGDVVKKQFTVCFEPDRVRRYTLNINNVAE